MSATRQPSAEPRIQIATVEIRVLKIGSKQMTQAVFNQLEDSPLIDLDTGELSGTPWGWVNYKCEWRKRQFVFERDGKLLRSLVSKFPHIPYKSSEYEQWPRSERLNDLVETGKQKAYAMATAMLKNGDIQTSEQWEQSAVFSAAGYEWLHRLENVGLSDIGYSPIPTDWKRVSIPQTLIECYRTVRTAQAEAAKLADSPMGEYEQRSLTRALQRTDRANEWMAAIRERSPNFGTKFQNQMRQDMKAAASEIGQFLQAWGMSFESLGAYDQLFIAV